MMNSLLSARYAIFALALICSSVLTMTAFAASDSTKAVNEAKAAATEAKAAAVEAKEAAGQAKAAAAEAKAAAGSTAGTANVGTAASEKPAAKAAAPAAADGPPVFDEAFLTNAENIATGGKLWAQCRHCHGNKAYPGKAPKLKPAKYTPEFAYKRITKGFRKMPPWEAVFSQQERMQLVAYIKSRSFSP